VSGIPVGSVLIRKYFAVPDGYTIGDPFDDHAAACAHARAEWRRRQETTEIPLNPPVVDERWVMRLPGGGEEWDVIFQRTPLGESARPPITHTGGRSS
jgi:hypothetical protein